MFEWGRQSWLKFQPKPSTEAGGLDTTRYKLTLQMDGGDEHALLEPTAATVEAENWNL